jgi:hypothetical protein
MEEEKNMIFRWRNFVKETHGSTMVLSAILLTVLLGFCGLAIDMGHYLVVKNELQDAADAGALAGVRALFPADLSTASNPVSPDCSNAVTVGEQSAQLNKTDNVATVVADIQAGRWDQVNRQFVAGCSSDPASLTNAIQVRTHRQDTPLFIMQVLGVSPKTLQATSVAVINWVGGLKKGKGFPVALAKKYAKCGENIKIYLNDDTCDTGCWYLPGDSSSDFTGTVSKVVSDPVNYPLPAVYKGDSVYLNNGVNTSTIQVVDSNYHGETVWLPVVDTIKLNQFMPVDGFCGVKILDVGKDNGKHYILVNPLKLTQAPGDAVSSNSGDDFGLLGPARLAF